MSLIAPVCFLVLGYAISGRGLSALLCVLLLGTIAAAGATFAVVALVLAQRAHLRHLVVIAGIGLALNSLLVAWAIRALLVGATAHFLPV
jgi:hypothetical protein